MKRNPLSRYPVTLVAVALSLPLTSAWSQRDCGGDRQGGQRVRGQQAAPIPTRATPRDRDAIGRRPPRTPPNTVTNPTPGQALEFPTQYRSVDGMGSNVRRPSQGSAGVRLLRLTEVSYADGQDAPSGDSLPSARAISNSCAAQDTSIPNAARASDYLWQWGQFVDHDIDLTHAAEPA